ncbi:MAG TPA: SRPBCC domain-containing protein [Microlunatus sp.]
MQLTHTFEIAAPVDQVFDVFGRLDLLAPCFPGASVWGRDGEVYHGAVKIKLGPFPLVFEGTARVVRADLADRRLVVKANARDRRGAAAGAATVTATFSAKGSDRTWAEVATDLDLTGRPAQLGSGTISSVSDRLADQFVGCISAKLAAGLVADEPVESPESVGSVAEGSASTVAAGEPDQTASPLAAPGSRPSQYAYRPPNPSESAPHLQVLPDIARTWLPWVGGAVGGLAVLVLVIGWLRRR